MVVCGVYNLSQKIWSITKPDVSLTCFKHIHIHSTLILSDSQSLLASHNALKSFEDKCKNAYREPIKQIIYKYLDSLAITTPFWRVWFKLLNI